ncbi:low temperature requirement protein A [Micromonospora sp. GCM10011542]|uniref:low temperature requirement protein A n=1 Tax=Micromonospora sp. GCM10011542 TaxID=3317337 RepID=UPI0036216B5A
MPTLRLGRSFERVAEFAISAEHLAERYRQLFIIGLGELILVTGLTFSHGTFEPDRVTAVVFASATTALMWRIYIHRAGGLIAEAIAAAPDPHRAAVTTMRAHLLMVAGIVAIAVGDELVIEHPLGHTPSAWIIVILGGPALFLAGRGLFEYEVFGRVSRSRPIGVLVLAATSPAAFFLPPLLVAMAPALVAGGSRHVRSDRRGRG